MGENRRLEAQGLGQMMGAVTVSVSASVERSVVTRTQTMILIYVALGSWQTFHGHDAATRSGTQVNEITRLTRRFDLIPGSLRVPRAIPLRDGRLANSLEVRR